MGRLEIKEGPNGERIACYWGDGKTPTRKRAVKGIVITEKLPAVPSRQYVNNAGNIVHIAIANAAADIQGADYGTKIEMLKRQAGMVPADTCPIADRESIQWFDGLLSHGEEPCEGYARADGRAIRVGPNRMCKHTATLAAARAEAHAAKEKAFADTVFKDQFLKQGEMIASAVKEAITEAANIGRRQGGSKDK